MLRQFAVAIIMLSAACNRQEEPATPANESVAANQAKAEETPSLEGQWRVTALDGKPVGETSAMTASFASGKVSISSGCVRRAWTYTQKRNVVSFTTDPGGSATCEGRGTTVEQETAYASLQDASIAIFNKDGSEANLSGTGGNLTLRR